MELRRGIYLALSLTLGTVLATTVGIWKDHGAADLAAHQTSIQQTDHSSGPEASPAARQPEFIAKATNSGGRPSGPEPESREPEVVPASFEQAESETSAARPAEATVVPEAAAPTAAAEPTEPTTVTDPESTVAAPESTVSEPATPVDTPPAPAEPPATTTSQLPAAPVGPPLATLAPADQTPDTEPAAQPAGSAAEAKAEPQESAGPAKLAALPWHDDYRQAMAAAFEQQRMLLIYFYDQGPTSQQSAFERESLGDPKICEHMNRDYVLARLPSGTTITSDGKPVKLLKHLAFAEMQGRAGIAVLDFAHPKADYFGAVVSTFPFAAGKYYSRPKLAAVLDLPAGTLTQRTMIYAVRVHPEVPASTQGQFNNVLADEALSHSKYQATTLVQGHQNWDSRFHRINTRLRSGVEAKEVVAESWPSESLVEACIDCVDSWHHSPGHWQAVRSRHRMFGFDIQRGRNGIWYATGIFSQR